MSGPREKVVRVLPDDESVLDFAEYQGRLFVMTTIGLYWLCNDKMVPVPWVVPSNAVERRIPEDA